MLDPNIWGQGIPVSENASQDQENSDVNQSPPQTGFSPNTTLQQLQNSIEDNSHGLELQEITSESAWVNRMQSQNSDSSSFSFLNNADLEDDENTPLLMRGVFPRLNIFALYSAIWIYMRILLASLLICYSGYLLLNSILFNKDECNNEKTSTGQKFDKCSMVETSNSSLRVVFAAGSLIILNPVRCSVLFNFFHKKEMIQLQVTLILWIVFILNNAEDGKCHHYFKFISCTNDLRAFIQRTRFQSRYRGEGNC